MNPDIVIPLGVVLIVFSVPVIAMLTRHQQRMAELINGNRVSAIDVASANEIRELKQLMHQQTLMLDRVLERQEQMEAQIARSLEPPPPVVHSD